MQLRSLAILGSSGLLFSEEEGNLGSCLEKPFLDAGAGNRGSGSLRCPGSEQFVEPHADPELHMCGQSRGGPGAAIWEWSGLEEHCRPGFGLLRLPQELLGPFATQLFLTFLAYLTGVVFAWGALSCFVLVTSPRGSFSIRNLRDAETSD